MIKFLLVSTDQLVVINTVILMLSGIAVYIYTVYVESFARLNFHGFRGFLEERESFPMNLLLYITSYIAT